LINSKLSIEAEPHQHTDIDPFLDFDVLHSIDHILATWQPFRLFRLLQVFLGLFLVLSFFIITRVLHPFYFPSLLLDLLFVLQVPFGKFRVLVVLEWAILIHVENFIHGVEGVELIDYQVWNCPFLLVLYDRGVQLRSQGHHLVSVEGVRHL